MSISQKKYLIFTQRHPDFSGCLQTESTFYGGFLQVDDILIFIPVILGEQTYTWIIF